MAIDNGDDWSENGSMKYYVQWKLEQSKIVVSVV